MGLYKLREWVGTVTGKGDRWGRDSVGRSAPAFMAASTTALPPLTCTVRQGKDDICGCCVLLLRGQPSAGCVFEACAGRRIRWLCPPAVACSAGCFVCLPLFACHAHCPHQFLPPFIALCPLFLPCAPGSSLYNILQAARLSCWQLQHGPAVAARAPVQC